MPSPSSVHGPWVRCAQPASPGLAGWMSWNTLRAARDLGPADIPAHIVDGARAAPPRTGGADPHVVRPRGARRRDPPRAAGVARDMVRVARRVRVGRVTLVRTTTPADTSAPMTGTAERTGQGTVVNSAPVRAGARTVGAPMSRVNGGPGPGMAATIGPAGVGPRTVVAVTVAGAPVTRARVRGVVRGRAADRRGPSARAVVRAVGRPTGVVTAAAGMTVWDAALVGTKAGVVTGAGTAAAAPTAGADPVSVVRVHGAVTGTPVGVSAAKAAGAVTASEVSSAGGRPRVVMATEIATASVVAAGRAMSSVAVVATRAAHGAARSIRVDSVRRAGAIGAGVIAVHGRATEGPAGTGDTPRRVLGARGTSPVVAGTPSGAPAVDGGVPMTGEARGVPMTAGVPSADPGREIVVGARVVRGRTAPGVRAVTTVGTSGRSIRGSNGRRTSPRPISTSM